MSPLWGVYDQAKADADIAVHAALPLVHNTPHFAKPVVGGYTVLQPWLPTLSEQAISAESIYAIPLVVPRKMTIDRIAVKVGTPDEAGFARLGLYNSGNDWVPSSLVLDAGVIALADSGLQALIINQQLSPGVYYAVFLSNSEVATIYGASSGTVIQLSTMDSMEGLAGYYGEGTYGALPESFPAGGAGFTTDWYLIAVRVKSLD